MFDNSYLSYTKNLVKIMGQSIVLEDTDDLDKYELTMLRLQNEGLKEEIESIEKREALIRGDEELFRKNISEIMGEDVDISDNQKKIPNEVLLKALDKTCGDPKSLIQPSHNHLKYSLIKKRQHLQELAPIKNTGSNLLNVLLRASTIRNSEIIREYTSDNTKRAFNGDIMYWQAWLSAIEFSFKEPISEEIVKLFIIQHVEEMDPNIDKMLVSQGYKAKLGSHSLETVKRRVIHLSVCLALDKHPNPCGSKELRMLIGRLSKKYGSKRKKKAITKDVLYDLLDTCENSVIDIRDRAILLFGWSSGGRRRSEIASAKIENLIETPEGDYIYRLGKTKTDQKGEGREVPVKGKAAQALKDWLSYVGSDSGPIFRSITKSGVVRDKPLSDIDINRIVKKRAKLSGYNETMFGAHSLRSGFVTEGGMKNKPLGDIMAMTTHRNVATVMKYYQSGAIINNSAANLAD